MAMNRAGVRDTGRVMKISSTTVLADYVAFKKLFIIFLRAANDDKTPLFFDFPRCVAPLRASKKRKKGASSRRFRFSQKIMNSF